MSGISPIFTCAHPRACAACSLQIPIASRTFHFVLPPYLLQAEDSASFCPKLSAGARNRYASTLSPIAQTILNLDAIGKTKSAMYGRPVVPLYLLVSSRDNGLCASAILYWALGFCSSSRTLRKTRHDSVVLNEGIFLNSSHCAPPNSGFTICDVHVCVQRIRLHSCESFSGSSISLYC